MPDPPFFKRPLIALDYLPQVFKPVESGACYTDENFQPRGPVGLSLVDVVLRRRDLVDAPARRRFRKPCNTRQPSQRHHHPGRRHGFSDTGCYGGEIETPNLNHLAAEGLRFTDFHNTARCCPSRASLLTGLYPHQAGVGRMTFRADDLPGYQGQLRQDTPTIAEVLKAAGYQTAMAGKWHISLTEEGPNHLKYLNNQLIRKTFADVNSYPIHRGFEHYFGIIWGVANYFDPFSLVNGEEAVQSVPKDFYLTDAIADHAIEYLRDFKQSPKPFFMYVAFTSPHWPLHARPEEIAKYKDTYQAGWDAIRETRYKRQVEMGLFNPDKAVLTPRAELERPWSSVEHKDFMASLMTAHAAMVDRMDQNIGRILETLRANGQMDNTLIFFLSDNGASPEVPGSGGFDRSTETRDGRHIMYRREMERKNIPAGPQTTYASIGPMWANAANTPFRYWKAQTYEGGICTPLIVHWPAVIHGHGEFRREPGHVIDLMATILDVTHSPFPNTFDNRPTTPPEGRSLLPAFADNPIGRDALFWEHEGNLAVRVGNWKAVNSMAGGGRWEIYNLNEDRTEMRDLSVREPLRLSSLISTWESWAKRADVVPAPPLPQERRRANN